MSAAIPDYVQPFDGWRVWRVSGDGSEVRLLSVVQETLWPPREELVAECLRRRILARFRRRRPRHEPPAERCACGIYATTLDRLGTYLYGRGHFRTRYVFGRVRLWGTVIECEQGWRAARAYPAEILVPAPAERTQARATAEEIAHGLSLYGVPVVVLPHAPGEALDVVAHEQGRPGHIGSTRW
jgi:hypothetical protein